MLLHFGNHVFQRSHIRLIFQERPYNAPCSFIQELPMWDIPFVCGGHGRGFVQPPAVSKLVGRAGRAAPRVSVFRREPAGAAAWWAPLRAAKCCIAADPGAHHSAVLEPCWSHLPGGLSICCGRSHVNALALRAALRIPSPRLARSMQLWGSVGPHAPRFGRITARTAGVRVGRGRRVVGRFYNLAAT